MTAQNVDEIDILRAVRDTILQTSGWAIQTPLTQDAAVGSRSVFVNPQDPAFGDFVTEGVVGFDDDLEPVPWLPIIGTNSQTGEITLGFAGLEQFYPTPGLAATHTAGTNVYTNLVLYTYWDASKMLATGKGVVWVTSRGHTSGIESPLRSQSLHRVHIQYQRALDAPPADPVTNVKIAPRFWELLQEKAAREDLRRIEAAILANPHLATNRTAPVAAMLGGEGNTTKWTDVHIEPRFVVGDSLQFVAIITVWVLDRGRVRRPIPAGQ